MLLMLCFCSVPDILVTLEKEHLRAERDQLNISLNQEQTRNINLTEERDDLQTRLNILQGKTRQLEDEQKRIKAELEGESAF